MSERKWTKGHEWVVGVMKTDGVDAHAYRRDIDADRGSSALEESVNARYVVSELYEALKEAEDWIVGIVNNMSIDGSFDPAPLAKARAALQRAEGEGQ